MKRSVALVALMISFSLLSDPARAEECDGFKPMFNGKNLDGWYTFLQKHGKDSDPDKIVTYEDGIFHFYKHATHGDHVVQGYIGTNEEYSNYHFRCQYKWGEKKFKPRFEILQDGGIYYHMVMPDRVWPRAMQYQIERTNISDIVTVGSLRYETTVDPKTKDAQKPRHLPADKGGVEHTHGLAGITHLSPNGMHEKDGWNTIDIVVRGDTAIHYLNGHETNRCKNIRMPDPKNKGKFIPLTQGRILLEIEAAELFMRNIEIKDFDAMEEKAESEEADEVVEEVVEEEAGRQSRRRTRRAIRRGE